MPQAGWVAKHELFRSILSAMISAADFSKDLREFVRLYNEDPKCEEEFKLYEGAQGPYAEQRALVVSKEGDRRAVRLISVAYNEAFEVPVLWFNFYSEQGGLLHVDEFLPFLSTESSSSSVLQGLSQNEHPVHGIAFYNVHPCRTAELLKPLETRNYLLTWLSVYGALLRLDVSEANQRVGS